jgi:hypothetical protein
MLNIKISNLFKTTLLMKSYFLGLLFAVLALTSCKKENPTLTGTHSMSSFTYTIKRIPGGDTLPFSNTAVFSNTSVDAFSYLWDFGDLAKSSLENPTHSYIGGTSFLVRLTSVGSYGYNVSEQTIKMESPCDYEPFSFLSGCSNRSWSVSPLPNGIKVIKPNGDTIVSSATICMFNDQYTFGITGVFNYNSLGNTVNEVGVCVGSRDNVKKYIMKRASGTANPTIVLLRDSSAKVPFIGLADSVIGDSYEVLRINEVDMVLESKLKNGDRVQVLFRNISPSIKNIKLDLCGGSRKTWKLDPVGTSSITAGTESNPILYYAGGALAPCQLNDEYTFTSTDSLYINFNNDALVFGGPNDYNCKPFSLGGTKFILSPVTTFSGLAQIVLKNGRVGVNVTEGEFFIGAMDNSQNLYRILSLSPTNLLIRIGDGSGTVQTIKFVAKP